MSIRISPSILSADFANLERDLQRIADADLVHVDVMDGHFVPNLTLGLPVVQRLGEVSPVPLDLHLMIDDADRWAPRYAETGAFSVTFSAEAATDPVSTARAVRSNGARASVAVKPGTDLEPYLQSLDAYDMILVMTVEPGFGGQSFIPEALKKIAIARRLIDESGRDILLEVDGGIKAENIAAAAAAGADTFVAGSAIFGKPDYKAVIDAMRAELATVAR